MNFEVPYLLVDEIAPNSDSANSAAQVHGILTGMLCVDEKSPCSAWIGYAFGDGDDDLSESQREILQDLCRETQSLLECEDYSFHLFLPDDETGIEERGAALGEWCEGFLLGIGFGVGDGQWPAECNEVLKDLMEIAQLDAEGGNEEDLSELIEFVRISAQYVRSEFRNQARKARLH